MASKAAESVVKAATAAISSSKKVDLTRRMHYPYTLSAKMVQFPWKFHWDNSVFFRYYIYGVICTFPLIYKIHKLANCPENVAKWDEIHRQNLEHAKHQFDD